MPILTSQDFIKGVDATGINPITGGDLNNLVDLAATKDDGAGCGKALVLTTLDTAINTPNVPNANVNVKWKRYLWNRKPFLGQNANVPQVYAWNDNLVQDPLFLKWVQVTVDVTTIQAEIDAANAAAQTALATANTALGTANASSVAASAAQAAANSAQADATTAANAAAGALVEATSAQQTASSAKVIADEAVVTASAKKNINSALIPGTPGQKIRTNTAADAVEWYNDINQYVKVSHSPNKNTAPEDGVAADWVKRKIDTEDSDTGNLVTLATDIITFAVPGIYRVNIICPAVNATSHKAVLIDTDSNLVLLTGTNCSCSAGASETTNSIITGTITITDVIKNLAIYHYTTIAGKLGSAAALNIDYPKVAGVATKEVYMVCEFWKIN